MIAPGSADTTSRRGLVTGLVLGVPVIMFGIRGIVLDAHDSHPAELTRWVVGSAVATDLVVLPAAGIIGWVLHRVTPAAAWPSVRTGALAVGTLALVSWPFARGYGATEGNPSLLPRDYVLGPALAVAGIVAATLVAAATAVLRQRRSR